MSDQWLNLAKEAGATLLVTKTSTTAWADEGTGGNSVELRNGASGGNKLTNSDMFDAVELDGIDDYAIAQASTDFDVVDPCSFEWIMAAQLSTESEATLMHYGPNATLNGFHILLGAANAVPYVTCKIREAAGTLANTRVTNGGGRNIVFGALEHWSIVYTGGAVTIYKNGDSVATEGQVFADDSAAALYIGRRDAATVNSFNGIMGAVAYYKSVELSAAQVKAHSDALMSPPIRGRRFGSERTSNRLMASGWT